MATQTYNIAQPCMGLNVGDPVDLEDAAAQWWVQNGYVTTPGSVVDKTKATSSPASTDPQLPPNAGPPEPVVPHIANAFMESSGVGTSNDDGTPNTQGAEQDVQTYSYEPGDHTVQEVNDYLDTVDLPEIRRVMELEVAGKNRTGITEGPHDLTPEEEV